MLRLDGASQSHSTSSILPWSKSSFSHRNCFKISRWGSDSRAMVLPKTFINSFFAGIRMRTKMALSRIKPAQTPLIQRWTGQRYSNKTIATYLPTPSVSAISEEFESALGVTYTTSTAMMTKKTGRSGPVRNTRRNTSFLTGTTSMVTRLPCATTLPARPRRPLSHS
ncbi:hypothetical protein BDV96DRAFT_563017 [Lophiotrema nucula]|uniref:Uncharacterized protein n=1 Tax=Lophiotrema nucula TaxID=690887 RepID=A0A6A5ZR54_9PLEO|nr:hypothetical protein BDV96DRAFT_563017 [Lophiotrema nucula]